MPIMSGPRPPLGRAAVPLLLLVFVALWTVGMTSAWPLGATYDHNASIRALYHARAAKCPLEGIKNWSCGEACREEDSLEVVDVFENVQMGVQAFMVVDYTNEDIIIGFGSSNRLQNWLMSPEFVLWPYPDSAGARGLHSGSVRRVHGGFWRMYESIQGEVLAAAARARTAFPGYSFLVVGHSVSGVLAELCGANLASVDWCAGAVDAAEAASCPQFSAVRVYSYGAPRVGDSALSSWMTNVIWRSANGNTTRTGALFRVTHDRDPVPRFPPLFYGYRHPATEIFYYDDKNVTDYKVCADTGRWENPRCSHGRLGYEMSDHKTYLGMCTECECESAPMDGAMPAGADA